MDIGRFIRTAGLLLCVGGATLGIPQERTSPGPSLEPERLSAPAERLNDLARFVAGVEVDKHSELYDLTQTGEWTRFADDEDLRWDAFAKTADKVRSWVKSEVTPHKTENPVEFYPFGGPDILFATLMRPAAKLYLLIGLEPVGSVPDPEVIRQAPLAGYLAQYSKSLDDILRLSFFRRADLEAEMKTPVIDGVLPVFMVLLARTGREITSVERGRVNTAGEFVDAANDPGRKPKALRLVFRDRGGHGETHTLIYLSQDLSNPAVDSSRGFQAFIDKNVNHGFGFIKSASYQMHKPVFSSIANIILRVSDVVLEDDSAIPYRLFDQSVWKISLFGDYTGPIDLFKEFFEQDLRDAYAAGSAKPLAFRFGYGRRPTVLLAVRRPS